MRLKRLCEKKLKSKKCHVDDQTHEQFAAGGPQREWLEMALLEALQSVGPEALARGKSSHTQVLARGLHAKPSHIPLNPNPSVIGETLLRQASKSKSLRSERDNISKSPKAMGNG